MSKRCPNDVQMTSKWCPNDDQTMSKWFPNDVRMMPKWCPTDVQMMSKWCPNDVQLMSNWCPNDVQMMSKWCPNDAQRIVLYFVLCIVLFIVWCVFLSCRKFSVFACSHGFSCWHWFSVVFINNKFGSCSMVSMDFGGLYSFPWLSSLSDDLSQLSLELVDFIKLSLFSFVW